MNSAALANLEVITPTDGMPTRSPATASCKLHEEQLRQVFLRTMRAHPEDWHLSASGLTANAFTAAWPYD